MDGSRCSDFVCGVEVLAWSVRLSVVSFRVCCVVIVCVGLLWGPGGGCMWLLGKVIACFFMCCMVGCLSVSGPACAWGERFCICCMASCVVLILYWEFCFSRVVMVIELPCIFLCLL